MRIVDIFARSAAARASSARLETEIRNAIELRGENGKGGWKSENAPSGQEIGFYAIAVGFIVSVLLLIP